MSKNFSLLLALRYLNPIRTHVSVITMISLLGVAAGVMVLAVTLSVMNGFEDFTKKIILSSTPHINAQHASAVYTDIDTLPPEEWEPLIKELEKEDYIESVSPRVVDFVVMEFDGYLQPSPMQGVDPYSEAELAKIDKQIEEGNGKAADLQNGDVAIISSSVADQLNIKIGDKILLNSSSNLKQVKPMREKINSPIFAERHQEEIEYITADIQSEELWRVTEEAEIADLGLARDIANNFAKFHRDDITNNRAAERELLGFIRDTLRDNVISKDEESQTIHYEIGTRKDVLSLFADLKALDIQSMDYHEMQNLQSAIVPQELEVVAIYQTSNFYRGVIFVPLFIAQDLVGLQGGIQGLGISIKDPDQAALVVEKLFSDPKFPFKDKSLWQPITWMEASKAQFDLIVLQKFMMIFVLSFIVLIAVFSISAVMFTVAIQKKREIGVMKALGATPRQVINVFAYQGFIVGLLGSLLGITLAYVVITHLAEIQWFMREYLGFNPFPKHYYGTDTMPSKMKLSEFVTVGLGALFLCTVASLLPAWTASRTDAARSLRNL